MHTVSSDEYRAHVPYTTPRMRNKRKYDVM